MKTYKLGQLVNNYDRLRKPLSNLQRSSMKGPYPYYGAACVFDYVDQYIFDGDFILLGEDGTVINSDGTPVLQRISGKAWVNNHAHVLKNNSLIDFDYLYYALKNSVFTGAVTGAVQPKISQANMNAVEITIHEDLADQRKVASVLGALDRKIEINNKINGCLFAKAQAVFDSQYDASNENVYLSTIIEVLGGGTPKTNIPSYWNGNIPFFAPGDALETFVIKTEKHITQVGLDNCNSDLYPAGTTFITARGTVGKICLSGVAMAMNQSCFALKAKTISNEIAFLYIQKSLRKLLGKANGAVFDALTSKDIREEKINRLPQNAEANVQRVIKPLFDEILVRQFENEKLTLLRDSLLPRLMSGEVDVDSIVVN